MKYKNKKYLKKDTEKMFIKLIKKLQYKVEHNKISLDYYLNKKRYIYNYLRKNYKVSVKKSIKYNITIKSKFSDLLFLSSQIYTP